MPSLWIPVLTLLALYAAGFPVRAGLRRLRVPPAVSLMTLGALAGPGLLDLLPDVAPRPGQPEVHPAWLDLRLVLSQCAFVVLLLRAGVGLPPRGLRAVLLPALVLGSLPVAAELLVVFGLSRAFLFPDAATALLCGFLIAAVSPAVVLPVMLEQKARGRGAMRLVPDRIMGQTIVNVFIAQAGILLLTDVVCAPDGGAGPGLELALLPVMLLGGILLGSLTGWLLRIDSLLPDDDASDQRWRSWGAIAILLAGGLAVYFGSHAIGLESVFATLALGIALRRRLDTAEPFLRVMLRRVWSLAEVILFVNLGTQIDLAVLHDTGLMALLLGILAAGLLARLVLAAVLGMRTSLDSGERRYAVIAHLPKATVQAVYGAYPLTLFLRRSPGDAVLADQGMQLLLFSALAIVATAPVGAVLLDRLGGRWLRG